MKQFRLTPTSLFLFTFLLGLFFTWSHPFNFTSFINSVVVSMTGVIILMSSFVLNLLAYREFKKYHTPHAPFVATRVLMRKSVFSISRNPVYLALILSELGLAFVFDTIWLIVCSGVLWISLDILVVSDEEKVLSNTFKQEYSGYKKKTRRWL